METVVDHDSIHFKPKNNDIHNIIILKIDKVTADLFDVYDHAQNSKFGRG